MGELLEARSMTKLYGVVIGVNDVDLDLDPGAPRHPFLSAHRRYAWGEMPRREKELVPPRRISYNISMSAAGRGFDSRHSRRGETFEVQRRCVPTCS